MKVTRTSSFKKDFKKFQNEISFDIDFINVIHDILNKKELLKKYKDHILIGNWSGFRECHVKPDLLLIYKYEKNELILARLNSHSEIFN